MRFDGCAAAAVAALLAAGRARIARGAGFSSAPGLKGLMRNKRPLACLVLTFALALGGAAPAETAKSKAKASAVAAAPAPQCARGNYPGDPVCAWEDDGRNLPTPSARAVRREIPDDVVINDAVSVGSADPIAMAKPPMQSPNRYPTRKKEPVGGGAAVNYKF